MHMLARKDLKSAELETERVSRNPTTVITAKITDTPVSGPVVRKPHLIWKNTMQHGEVRAHRCSGIANWTFQLVHEYILNIGIAGLNNGR